MNCTMAQASLRRPPIDVRPQHAWVRQFLAFATHHAKACLAIGVERARVIDGAGVERQPRRATGKAALDRAVEQPRSDAPADIVEREPKKHDLVGVELEVADESTVVTRDVQLVAGPVDQGSEGGIAELPPLVPKPWATDAVIEVEIECGSRV